MPYCSMYGSLSWLPRTPNFGSATRSSVSSHAVCRSPRQITASRSCWRASTPASAWKGRSARASARIRYILPDRVPPPPRRSRCRGPAVRRAGRCAERRSCVESHIGPGARSFRFLREFAQALRASLHGANPGSRAESASRPPANRCAESRHSRERCAARSSPSKCAFDALTEPRPHRSVAPHARTRQTEGCVHDRTLCRGRGHGGNADAAGAHGGDGGPRGRRHPRGEPEPVDYHAEAAPAKPADGGTTIIGGNIQITSDRGSKDGVAGDCDPDPRFGTHPRPDDEGCTWDEPVGSGQDFIAFGRHIAQQDVSPIGSGDTGSGSGGGGMGDISGDTDTSPDGAYVPVTTPTRESFNGRGGLDKDGNPFLEDRPVLEDEDLGFQITGAEIYNYLAPQGNADNRWRRLCGEGSSRRSRTTRTTAGRSRRGHRAVRRPDLGRGLEGPVRPRRRQPGLLHHRRLPAGDELRREDLPGDEAGVPAGRPRTRRRRRSARRPGAEAGRGGRRAPAAGAVKGVSVRRGTARLAAVGTCPITSPVPCACAGARSAA